MEQSGIRVGDIRSLTDFKRDTPAFIKRLKKSGRAQVLTVKGRPAVVVQDSAAYQRMLDAVERAEVIEAVHASMAEVEAGRTRPLADVLRGLGR